jgi:hypothetical protein
MPIAPPLGHSRLPLSMQKFFRRRTVFLDAVSEQNSPRCQELLAAPARELVLVLRHDCIGAKRRSISVSGKRQGGG